MRVVRALLLHRVPQCGWGIAVPFWLMLLVWAWPASPVFLAQLGMPAPGTAPRYTGTVRTEYVLCGRNCSTRYRYILRTADGEMPFHCGFRPQPRECQLSDPYGPKPDPQGVYVIGYDPYWGVDHVQPPPGMAFDNARNQPSEIQRLRLRYLDQQREFAWIFAGILAVYGALVAWSFALQAGQGGAGDNRGRGGCGAR